MKKVLLLAAVACAALAANAQALQTLKPETGFVKANPFTTSIAKAPAQKADLKDNQVIVGLYNTDDIDQYGLGLGSAVSLMIASEIPADCFAGMNDLKIDAVRFGLTEAATVESVNVYATDAAGNLTPLVEGAPVVSKKGVVGWNTVELAEPIAVPADVAGLIVGYDITLTASGYPIGVYSGADQCSFFGYGDLGQGEGWYNFGDSYGTPAIQLVCECAPVQGFSVKGSKYETGTVAMGQKFESTFTVMSSSEAEVKDIDYTIIFGDETISKNIVFKTPIPAGFGKTASFDVELTAPQRPGALPVIFSVDKINGTELAEPVVTTFTQDVVTKIVPRYHVVEEFTGTGCGFCPLGWAGMEYTKENYSDKAGVIAIHQYNNTDPMYGTYYHTPDFAGAPSCMIDRFPEELNPYAENMGQYFQVLDQLIPEVDVKVWAAYTDETMTKVDAYASTEFLTDLDGSELVFVLTADGLTGTTSAWKQSNYLYQYAASQYPASAKEFCKGGKYAQSSVTLVFNDVMIGSSWPSATGANKVEPFPLTAAGYKVGSSYTLSLPTKTALKNALQKEQIYVTAMVIKADGMIANAARCRVLTADEAAGISSVTTEAENAALYDLQGRKVNAAAHGIFIQNGKKVIR